MALTKSQRIQILLAIDVVFFLIELIVGYSVHSLALVADSFHMLNDVLSLCVGLWAVKVASSKKRSNVYTYGWQRAETLGALVNGVFLVALCVTIFLEAVQRFFEPQEVSHPILILVVGSCGLASNLIGLALFHDHGHGHGHSHSHGERKRKSSERSAEEGHSHAHSIGVDAGTAVAADGSGQDKKAKPVAPLKRAGSSSGSKAVSFGSPSSPRRSRRRSRSRTYSTLEDLPVHPASFRQDIIAASRLEDVASESEPDSPNESALDDAGLPEVGEQTPLLTGGKANNNTANGLPSPRKIAHNDHNHSKPRDAGKHGHSHDLNMRGVFLHVLGDALGNVGVIATALFIWLTPFKWRFYSDPAISLVITIIILTSAIPLCKAASRILLQAVPTGLNVDELKEDISSLPGISGVHHLHVWQLSDTKLVASLHVRVKFDFKGEGSEDYMLLARQVRKCLHGYGIHSSTIQPEFCCEHNPRHYGTEEPTTEDESCREDDSSEETNVGRNRASSGACLLDCDDECGDGGKCCAPVDTVDNH